MGETTIALRERIHELRARSMNRVYRIKEASDLMAQLEADKAVIDTEILGVEEQLVKARARDSRRSILDLFR